MVIVGEVSGEQTPWLFTDGWATVDLGEGRGLHVKGKEQEGRWVITDLYLHGEEITPATLREISLSRLEAALNAGEQKIPSEGLFKQPAGGDQLEKLHKRHGDVQRGKLTHHGVERLETPERPRLTRPDGTDPDSFYTQVGAAYRDHARKTNAPAAAIAEEADVPVTTAHRWVREARRRGFLPPGRKGKAG